MPNISSGSLLIAGRLLSRAVGFACSHPAFLRPAVWRLGFASLLLVALLFALGGLWAGTLIATVLLAIPVVGLVGWTRLMRVSDRPILAFISRLAPATTEAHSASVNHQLALLEMLEADDLSAHVEGRRLSPLRKAAAERVLSECPGQVVFYGEARVAGKRWIAKGGILVDATTPVLDGSGRRDVTAPTRHEFRDPDLGLDTLVGDAFSAPHVETLRAELLDLAAAIEP